MEDLHLGVKALGDSVVAGEPPHVGDFLSSGIEGMAAPALCFEGVSSALGHEYRPSTAVQYRAHAATSLGGR